MTGKISDSMCGASHAKMIAGHAGWTDKDCTQACIKGGGKYVFVSSDGKVYNISNQTESGLAKYAGEDAKVTADFGNDTITVSKIAAAKEEASGVRPATAQRDRDMLAGGSRQRARHRFPA